MMIEWQKARDAIMDMNANDGIAANREYKDRLFTFIFGKE